jgi:SPP1 gp7 family putative phage head morphogenesis protein
METANEMLLDAAVRHSIDLTRYSNGTVRKIIALLNRSDADIVAQLQAIDSDGFTKKRLEKLLTELRIINRDAYDLIERELTAELAALADYEAGFQVRAIQSALPIELAIVQPTAAQVYAAAMARPFQGRILKDWGKDLEASAFAKVRDAIRIGFTEGETIDQMVRRVRGTRARNYADGALQISRRNAESVVRTAVTHTANAARQETYAQNKSVVDKVRWTSTLDGRTTLVCMGRDGVTYPVDSGPRPPAHFGCRSTTVPVVKSWRDLGFDIDELDPATRASMSGQVPATETYGSWLKKQPAEFQDNVLGDTRADLFRKGDLSVDRFTDSKGSEYTLDQLRAREPKAFKRAGL